MLSKWTSELAARVSRHLEAILYEPEASPPWKVEATRRTNGLPVYADMGGVIALTLSGEFVSYDPESDAVTPVRESVWNGVGLASLARQYPDLGELLPVRPSEASVCSNCSGSGWMMDGRLFCRMCQGLGWIK